MAKKTKERPVSEIKVLAQTETKKGVYSNLAAINHSQNEFIIDFMLRILDETQLISRIILSPQHIKLLHDAIGRNIKKFEGKFGTIKITKNSIN